MMGAGCEPLSHVELSVDPALPRSAKLLLHALWQTPLDEVTKRELSCQAEDFWLRSTGTPPELPIHVNRLIMQDFTAVPAFVDLCHLREAKPVDTRIGVDVILDHSMDVGAFGNRQAAEENLRRDVESNEERYQFLDWCSRHFSNVRVVPPGSGICHQINLEFLSEPVFTDAAGRVRPELMCGTDSHSTMVGALGVLGWGLGGQDAVSAALGEPLIISCPEVYGVELTGTFREGVCITDLALTLTRFFREELPLGGAAVELFGVGLGGLTVEDRAVIANMAPECGAMFINMPIDEQTGEYLRSTGRTAAAVGLADFAVRNCFDHPARYAGGVVIDLDTVSWSVAGPAKPSQLITLAGRPASQEPAPVNAARSGATSPDVNASAVDDAFEETIVDSIVIASITSCTNTSNPDLLIAAGILAQKAAALGLAPPAWVKTTLVPGSKIVVDYLASAGLLLWLEKLGFFVVGFGCGTCNGNSGQLTDAGARLLDGRQGTAVLSGNRNFPGRINPSVGDAYLMSPPLVVAYALKGRFTPDLWAEPLRPGADGSTPVYLQDIWPTSQEVAEVRRAQLPVGPQFRDRYAALLGLHEALQDAPLTRYPWDDSSTFIRPPLTAPRCFDTAADVEQARCLLHLGDDITTDHISPGGRVPSSGLAGRWLAEHGVRQVDFSSYGARRGNAEVMLRGAFTNRTLRNLMTPQSPGGFTTFDDETLPVYEASRRHLERGVPLVVVAGKRYGSGSSRDWAAKATALLGVRAVLAESFERIHRINLVNVGVLPVQIDHDVYQVIDSRQPIDLVGVEAALFDGSPLRVVNGPRQHVGRLVVATKREREVLLDHGLYAYLLKR